MKRRLSAVLAMILATASSLSSRAADVSIPVQALLNKDLQEVRRAFVGDLPSGNQDAMSVFETAAVRIEAFDRIDLIQTSGCQAYFWPNEAALPAPPVDYNFVFANGKLQTIVKLIAATPIYRDKKVSYREGPAPILRSSEHLPLEVGATTYVADLLAAAPPIDRDIKVHCDQGGEVPNSPFVSPDEKLFASIRVGMDLDARSFAHVHRGVASLFEGSGERYYVLSIKQRLPFVQELKNGGAYKFVGVRDGRVEWIATGAFAGGVGAGICLSERNSVAPRNHCSSQGVFYP